MGQGPMTGGGRGWCGGAALAMGVPANGQGYGRGQRQRFGQRTQIGWPETPINFPTTLSQDQRLAGLKEQVERLEMALGQLKSKIHDLGETSAITESERK